MKATKFTLASVAFAAMLAAGVTTTSADVTTASNDTGVTLKAQNSEMDSNAALAPDSPTEFDALQTPRTVTYVDAFTYYRDTEGEDIAQVQNFIHGTEGVEIPDGYVLIGTSVDEYGDLIHTFTSQTTINFTAQFNDGRQDANFSWTFPAKTRITYNELFNMAGLNPDDFDLADQDWNGQI